MHELCYATSTSPTAGFEYGGVIVSNCDLHIDTYKPADMPMYYGGNNHGSIIKMNADWYIFYHRHTNGDAFNRQGCIEKISFQEDGSIPQVEMTSCGANGGALEGKGEYPAHIACNLFTRDDQIYTGGFGAGAWLDSRFPKITQDGRDGDEEIGYIANMVDSATAGFKYSHCHGIRQVTLKVRGYCSGAFEVKTSWDGQFWEPSRFTLPMNGRLTPRQLPSRTVYKHCILRIKEMAGQVLLHSPWNRMLGGLQRMPQEKRLHAFSGM